MPLAYLPENPSQSLYEFSFPIELITPQLQLPTYPVIYTEERFDEDFFGAEREAVVFSPKQTYVKNLQFKLVIPQGTPAHYQTGQHQASYHPYK